MRTPDKAIEAGAWLLENGHRALLKISGGRYPRTLLGMRPIELRTKGLKTGQVALDTADSTDLRRAAGRRRRVEGWPPGASAVVPEPCRQPRCRGQHLIRVAINAARTVSMDGKGAIWPQIVVLGRGHEGYRATQRDILVKSSVNLTFLESPEGVERLGYHWVDIECTVEPKLNETLSHKSSRRG